MEFVLSTNIPTVARNSRSLRKIFWLWDFARFIGNVVARVIDKALGIRDGVELHVIEPDFAGRPEETGAQDALAGSWRDAKGLLGFLPGCGSLERSQPIMSQVSPVLVVKRNSH